MARQPGAQWQTAVRASVVRDVRVAMHDASDTMAAEVGIHLDARRVRDVADRGRDVADLVANDSGLDSCRKSHLGELDDAKVRHAGCADDDAEGRVADPAPHRGGEVE